MSEGLIGRNADVLDAAKKGNIELLKRGVGEAGGDIYNAASKTGKGILITWWILIVAIFIYMIILAIIYYNEYTKWKYNDITKQWQHCTSDKNDVQTCEIYEGLTEDDIITWNIHKTVMNGLLAFMNIFGIIIFVFGTVGSEEKVGKDICGCNQLGWICFIDMIWFIVNMVWDIKFSQYTKTSQADASTTEKFCGMMETFCGSVSEGFANVNKKLRKF